VIAQIVLFDGCDPLDVIAPFEILVAGSDAVGGELAVELVSAEGPVPVRDIATNGQRVTWRQTVTKPMRLNLDLDTTIDGDIRTGHSKAGRLPRSAVSGVRRS
jgi:hypothetical protein